MSYFGKFWFYLCYGRSSSGCDWYSSAFNTMVNKNYRKCSTAFYYYDNAAKYLTDKKLKAKTYFIEANIFKEIKDFGQVGSNEIKLYGCRDYFHKNNNSSQNPYVEKLKDFSPEQYKFYQSICKF